MDNEIRQQQTLSPAPGVIEGGKVMTKQDESLTVI